MKKIIYVIALVFSTSVFSTSGSLWCSLSSFGTPTETAKKGATPYSLIQVDKTQDGSIQLFIEDTYHASTDVFNVTLLRSIGYQISNIDLGEYSGEKDVEIKNEGGRILLYLNGVRFFCEIPGNYKSDYSKDITN